MPLGWLGAAYALAGATCFALGNIAIVKASDARGDKGATLSVLITAVMAAAIWIVAEGATLPAAGDPRLMEALFYFALAGVLVMAIGRSLVFQSIRRLGATRASAVKRVNPFFSVLLAAVLLGETVNGIDAVGMAMIGAAFLLMIRQSFRKVDIHNASVPAIDYIWGVGAAACYATSYIARKFGLTALSLPAFGTMVSAIVGLVAVAVVGIFIRRYRDNVRNMFRYATPWTVAAGVAISFGQIFTFAALAHAQVMTVVMMSSLEIFISNVFAVVIFHTEKRAHWTTLLAGLLAASGAIAVASQ